MLSPWVDGAPRSQPLRRFFDGLGAGELAVAVLLGCAVWLGSVSGGVWVVALGLLLAVAALAVLRSRSLPPIPLVLAALVAGDAIAWLHAPGQATSGLLAAYFVKPLAALAVAATVTTPMQRRRVLAFVVLLLVTEMPVTAFQAIRAVADYGRSNATADAVTGTLGLGQAGVLGLTALAAAAIVVGAWLAGALRPVQALLLVVALLSIGVFTSTRASVVFVPAVSLALAAFYLLLLALPRPAVALAIGAAAGAAGIYLGTIALHPQAFAGMLSAQNASALGGAGAQGIRLPTAPVAGLGFSCGQVTGQNLLVNSSFENGLTAWGTLRGGRISLAGAEGTRVLRVSSNGERPNPAAVAQTVHVDPRNVYEASAWIRAARGLTVGVSLSDGAYANANTVTASGSWQFVCVALQPSTVSASVQLYMQANGTPSQFEANRIHLAQIAKPTLAAPAPTTTRPATTTPTTPTTTTSTTTTPAASPPHQAPAPASTATGVQLLPGRLAGLKFAVRLSVEGGTLAAVVGHGPGSSVLRGQYFVASDVPPAERTGITWFGTILTDTGWLGVLLFLGLLVWIGDLGRRLWRAAPARSLDRALGATLPALAALTALGALFANVFEVRAYSLVFWVVVGLALAAAADRGVLRPPRGPRGWRSGGAVRDSS